MGIEEEKLYGPVWQPPPFPLPFFSLLSKNIIFKTFLIFFFTFISHQYFILF